MVATVLYSGMRISEMLGLIWDDLDLATGLVRVRAQLSRAHRGERAQRVAPKTPASIRDIPLVAQLAQLLAAHRQATPFAAPGDWVFATGRGTPHGHRNVTRRGLNRAARIAGLDRSGWPPLRFHDLRHAFASHLIVDLGLDVAQVSRILGHARVTITLDVYTHLFDSSMTPGTQERFVRSWRQVSSPGCWTADRLTRLPTCWHCEAPEALRLGESLLDRLERSTRAGLRGARHQEARRGTAGGRLQPPVR